MAGGPPTAWQGGNGYASPSAPAFGSPRSASHVTARPADLDTASAAWKHVSRIVGADNKQTDLFDLLHSSARESQYSFQPPGWPPLLRPLTQLAELPQPVLERYNAVQTVAFCGVFPEIRRAWASVDNVLFLWRLDRWNDVPVSYNEEQQAIATVQLVRPRPGVFAEAIRHLLVICTTTEIVLLGVACGPGPTGQGDPYVELALQPLPSYSAPSDNVIMTCAAGTRTGRIFLGGADGRLYELKYGTGRNAGCKKVCHTGGLWDYLPSFLQRAASPIVELLVDDARGALYARTANSEVVLFDLGASGNEGPVRKAEFADLMAKAVNAPGGRDIFGGRTANEKKGAAIAHMAVIPPPESSRLHLLIVTADGRRVYFSTHGPAMPGTAAPPPRPSHLQVEICRGPPPQPSAAPQGRVGHAPQPPSRGLEVAAACYHRVGLLLAEAGGQDGRTGLLVTARDLSAPPTATATGAFTASAALRETVTELGMAIPGETCAIQPLDVQPPLSGAADFGLQDELRSQLFLPAPRYVLVSTSGTLQLERRRPVDMLWAILEERSPAKLDAFFRAFGAAEAACMCYQLAAAQLSAVPVGVQQAARAALEDSSLAGVPESQADSQPAAEPEPRPGGFDMGAAVPVAEPQWSGAHQGLALFLGRLLAPLGDRPLAAPADPRRPDGMLACTLHPEALQEVEDRLRLLSAFLGDVLSRARARADAGRGWSSLFDGQRGGQRGGVQPASKRPRVEEAAKQELQRTAEIAALAQRAAEAAFLVRLLSAHHLGRLAARLPPDMQQALKRVTLRELAATPEGESLAAQLISVLNTEHLSAPVGAADDLAGQLQGGAPTFFKADDRTFYKAAGLLRRAENAANGAERASLASQALQLMGRVPAAVDLGVVVPQLALLGAWDGVVSLPLQKAAAIDPDNQASVAGEAGQAARQARLDACYAPVAAVVRFLVNPQDEAALAVVHRDPGLSPEQRAQSLQVLLQAAASAGDPFFHEVVYSTLIDVGGVRQLLGLDSRSAHLESFLRSTGGLDGATAGSPLPPLQPEQVRAAALLAQLYVQRGAFDRAAAVHEALAMRRSGPGHGEEATLQQRVDSLRDAVLQARSYGHAGLVERLEGRLHVMELQQRTADALAERAEAAGGSGGESGSNSRAGDEAGEGAAQLREAPQELADLYNDYAAHFQLWGLCLEMVDVAGYSDPEYVRQLWDVHLKAAVDAAAAADGGRDGGDGHDTAPGLAAAAAEVEALGRKFYPSATSFPAAHVALRLEQIAAGQWPGQGPASSGDRAARAIIKATRDAFEARKVYDEVLALRGGTPGGDEAHAPLLRLRLLRSALAVLRDAAGQLSQQMPAYGAFGGGRGNGGRQARALDEAAEAYLTEARRLPPSEDADELAAELESLRRSLAGRAATY